MIALTRLSGSVFLLNVDLIERMDATPDTVITLVDGKKYVVAESLEEIRREVILHRAEIISAAASFDRRYDAVLADPRHGGHLAAVRSVPTGEADPKPDTRGGQPS